MGAMDRIRQKAEALEQQEQNKRAQEASRSRKRYRPEAGGLGLKASRLGFGGFMLVSWGFFIGLSFINNAGFWARYVTFPYLVLLVPLLLFTRGWIQMLFLSEGELLMKEYEKSIGACKGCAKAFPWLWGAVGLMETVYLLARRPAALLPELGFLAGVIAASAASFAFERYARGLAYTLWDPDSPVLQ